jgi:CrcB protein
MGLQFQAKPYGEGLAGCHGGILRNEIGFHVLGLDRSRVGSMPREDDRGEKGREKGKDGPDGLSDADGAAFGLGQGGTPVFSTPIIYSGHGIFPGMAWFWVAAGGALGSLLRFLLQGRLQAAFPGPFPAGTLAVNLAGSALIGCFAAFFASSAQESGFAARAFLMTGMLGGFTTFSSFSLENLNLVRAGEWRLAVVYILSSNALGILMALAGFRVCRALMRAG